MAATLIIIIKQEVEEEQQQQLGEVPAQICISNWKEISEMCNVNEIDKLKNEKMYKCFFKKCNA